MKQIYGHTFFLWVARTTRLIILCMFVLPFLRVDTKTELIRFHNAIVGELDQRVLNDYMKGGN